MNVQPTMLHNGINSSAVPSQTSNGGGVAGCRHTVQVAGLQIPFSVEPRRDHAKRRELFTDARRVSEVPKDLAKGCPLNGEVLPWMLYSLNAA